jgi:hypothetical protein
MRRRIYRRCRRNGAGFIDDVVVTFEHGDGEFVATQIFPDVFDRVEFGSVGRQADEGDVFGNGKVFGEVITGAVEDEYGVGAGSDPTADLGEMQGHGFGIGGWQDKRGGDAAPRTDGAEDVSPFVALIAWRAGPRSALSPDAGQPPMLTDARFVLEPDFDRLVLGAVGELRRDGRGEVFLNASWASSSAFGWRGRTESRRYPSFASSLPTDVRAARHRSVIPVRHANPPAASAPPP